MKLSLRKEVPVVGTYDVVVCGGGPAGFIAAIAAAREGARTALVEQYGFLGGAATNSLVTPLSVFTYNGEKVIGGIPWEFLERLEKMGGGLIEKPLGNVAFDPELYKLCCQRMVLEAGVDLYLHSWLSGCQTGQGRISHVFIDNKNGTEALAGKVMIDATGDADLSHLAGVPMLPPGRPLQPASTYFVLAGVDTESPLIAEAMHHNKQGVNCHCLPIREELMRRAKELGIPDFGGPWFCTLLHPGVVAVNMTRTQTDACDNRDYTAAECRLREDVYKMADILRENFPEFRNSYVSMVAPQAGVRETRRIQGVHVITGEDYVNGVRYPDSVSRGAHPIDIHSSAGATQSVTFLKQAAYVPYRALVANGFPNLLVAGRCISADRQAFASLRVQASCMGMGQAAGVAAAQAVRGETEVNVLQLDTKILASRLREIGACL